MFFEILYFLIIATSIILLIMENRKPYIAIFWVIILILLPVVGLLLYLLLGKDYRSHRVIKPDEMHRLAFLRDSANHHLIRKNTHSEKYDKLAAMMLHANDAPLFDGNNVRIFTDFTPMFAKLNKGSTFASCTTPSPTSSSAAATTTTCAAAASTSNPSSNSSPPCSPATSTAAPTAK